MLRWLSLYIVSIIWFVPSFSKRVFGGFDYQQIIYFGAMPGATDGTDWEVYLLVFKWLVIRPLILTLVVYGAYRLLGAVLRNRWKISKVVGWLMLLVLGLTGTNRLLEGVGYYAHLQKSFAEDTTGDYFTALPTDKLTPTRKLNLVTIYAESLENTFSNEEIFGSNLNAPLENVFGQTEFEMHPVGGTQWSIAGLVASQCGIPLAAFLKNAAGAYTNEFLGGVTCLSDILAEFGYYQEFLVGVDAKFSGMDKFAQTHGYTNVRGKFELEKFKIDHPRTSWGGALHDDTILEITADEIIKLHKSGQPFNFTVVLTDNHAQNGYLSPRCQTAGLNRQLLEVIQCTNKSIAAFTQRLSDENVLDDTVIVVMGDHLFMGNFDENLHGQKRSVYFNYLTKQIPETPTNITEISHFDVYPTMLSLVAGIDFPTLHLGVNLLTPDGDAKRRLHGYVFGSEYHSNAAFFKRFWDVK